MKCHHSLCPSFLTTRTTLCNICVRTASKTPKSTATIAFSRKLQNGYFYALEGENTCWNTTKRRAWMFNALLPIDCRLPTWRPIALKKKLKRETVVLRVLLSDQMTEPMTYCYIIHDYALSKSRQNVTKIQFILFLTSLLKTFLQIREEVVYVAVLYIYRYYIKCGK